MTKRRFYVTLFFALLIAYFAVGTYRNWPYKIESDGKYYYQYLVSAFFDGDLDFTNNYLTAAYEWMRLPIDHYGNHKAIHPITQHAANVFTVGPAILWAPFMGVAYGLGWLINLIMPKSIDLNPWGLYLQYGVMTAAVVYAVLALRGIEALLRQAQPNFSTAAIRVAQCLVLLASPMLYYSIFEVSMSHIYDLFTLVVYLWLWLGAINTPQPRWRVAALGLFGGLQILVRTQNILIMAVLSIMLMFVWWRQARQANHPICTLITPAGIYLATLAIAASPWPLVNIYLYANPFYVPQGEGFINLANANVLGVLFSMRNGLFSHHPVLLLGLVGFGHFAWRNWHRANARLLCLALAFIFIIQTYTNSIVLDWWGGHSFGQRRLLACLPLFALGLAHGVDLVRAHSQPWFRWVLLPISAVVCGLGVLLMGVHVLWWSYDEPHNIARWMFQYAPAKIASNASKPWATYIPIANPFVIGYPVRLAGGEPYQEVVVPVRADLQAGKTYVLDIEYATTGNAKPVMALVPKPKNPQTPRSQENGDEFPLNEALRPEANYVQKRLYFSPQVDVREGTLRLQNWSNNGVWGIQKMSLSEMILPIPDPPKPPIPTRFLFY